MYSLFGSLIINYMYKSFQFAKLENFIISQMAKNTDFWSNVQKLKKMDKYRTTKAMFYHKLRCSHVATPLIV